MTRASESCPHASDLPALLQGELDPAAARAALSHAEDCPACRDALADYRRVLAIIQRDPAIPNPRMHTAVMSSVAAMRAGPPRAAAAAAAAAAVMLAIALAASAFRQAAPPPSGPPAVASAASMHFSREHETLGRALDWLSQSQDGEGAFDPARFGGDKVFSVGITGLALLAFLGGERDPFHGPHADTIVLGLRFLRKSSSGDGCMSSPGPHLVYNQALASMALCEASRHPLSGVPRGEALAALGFLRTLQRDAGGFGWDTFTSRPNSSASAWAILALSSGESCGAGEFPEAASKALVFMSGLIDSSGRLGYRSEGDFPFGSEGLTAAGAMHFLRGRFPRLPDGRGGLLVRRLLDDVRFVDPMSDYCAAFFAASALDRAAGEEYAAASRRIREALASVQVKRGPDAGSFEPSDRWSHAGGRIYATAMAALALETTPVSGPALQRG